MNNLDYLIKEYKINLNVKTVEQMYMGTVFITFSSIPESKYIILNCDENILIIAVRHKGKEIPYNYNQFSHKLHIFCETENENSNQANETANNNNSNNNNEQKNDTNSNDSMNNQTTTQYIVCIQYQNKISPDYQGFFYVDDLTVAIHLFPHFSFLFVPCDVFTGENNDVNNQNQNDSSQKFSFKLTDISATITPSESSQIAASSIPSPQAVNFINNRKMFKFGKLKMPLPYFTAVIGEFTKYEIEIKPSNATSSDPTTQVHVFLDGYIQNDFIKPILSFIEKVVTKIEEAFNLKPFSNCVQIADISCYPEDQSSTAGLVIFTPETLTQYEANSHIIIKQIMKQYLNVFPASVNENWIIEGLSSYLSLVIMHSFFEDPQNEKSEFDFHSKMEIDQFFYQINFFRTALNSDSTSQVNSLDEKIDLIDDETLFDPLYLLKSTCLMRMIFLDKSFEIAQNCLRRLKEEVEAEGLLTIENFYDAFNCSQSEPFFDSYFRNQGHPVVILDDDLKLHQCRFSTSRNSKNFVWSIPLKITVLAVKEKENEDELEFEETEVVSVLFDKKELDLKSCLNSIDVDEQQKIILINANSESFCRVWYKGRWIVALAENASKLAKSRFERDLFDVFFDVSALAELGFIDRKFVEPFNLFPVPEKLKKRFPRLIGSSLLSEFK